MALETAVEKRIKVQLLHPITNDNIEYSRGLHELDEDLARLFLAQRVTGGFRKLIPVAIEWTGQPGVPRGTTKIVDY